MDLDPLMCINDVYSNVRKQWNEEMEKENVNKLMNYIIKAFEDHSMDHFILLECLSLDGF